MFLMWLGEQITERGIGNGISLIIFAGIAAGLPSSIAGLFELVRTGAMHPFTALLICVLVVLVTAFVVFVERGQRKILVNYAKRQVGNKIYGGQSSHLPLKLNMAGVIPPIFASSIILFPATLGQWFGSSESPDFCIKHHSVPRDAGTVVRIVGKSHLAARHLVHAGAGAADLRDALRGGNRLLLFLLHGAGL